MNAPPAGWIPVAYDMLPCASEEQVIANICASTSRDLFGFQAIAGRIEGAVHICGSAPSLRRTHKTISGDILAINGAIPYLVGERHIPRFAMIWDADPLCETFAVPHPDITYLVATRCHQSVFDKLAGCKVITWTAGGDQGVPELMAKDGLQAAVINGGSAGVTRAIYLAYALGYRELHLHGADSSLSENETHIQGSIVPERTMRVFFAGREFLTTPQYCAQVEELKTMWPIVHGNGATIHAHGEGFLPYAVSMLRQSMGPFNAAHSTT